MKFPTTFSGKHQKRTKKDLPPPIQGLDEKEIKKFYNLVPIKKLNPGDILIKEGDIDQTAYIIVTGKVAVQKKLNGNATEIGTLGKSEWVGEIALARRIPRTATATAIEPSSVMAVDQKILNTLEAKTQLHFFRQFNDLASRRIAQFEEREKKLNRKNKDRRRNKLNEDCEGFWFVFKAR